MALFTEKELRDRFERMSVSEKKEFYNLPRVRKEITSKLDALSSEVEFINPMLAYALDRVSDKLEATSVGDKNPSKEYSSGYLIGAVKRGVIDLKAAILDLNKQYDLLVPHKDLVPNNLKEITSTLKGIVGDLEKALEMGK